MSREGLKRSSFLKRHFSCLFKKSESGNPDPCGHAQIKKHQPKLVIEIFYFPNNPPSNPPIPPCLVAAEMASPIPNSPSPS